MLSFSLSKQNLKQECTWQSNHPKRSIKEPRLTQTAWNFLYRHGRDSTFLGATELTRDLFVEEPLLMFDEARLDLGTLLTIPRFALVQTAKSHNFFVRYVWYVFALSANEWIYAGHLLIFGLTSSCLSAWLDYTQELLLPMTLKSRFGPFRVRLLIVSSAALWKNKCSYRIILDETFAVTGGSRLQFILFEKKDIRNFYFQGFSQQLEVTNLLV